MFTRTTFTPMLTYLTSANTLRFAAVLLLAYFFGAEASSLLIAFAGTGDGCTDADGADGSCSCDGCSSDGEGDAGTSTPYLYLKTKEGYEMQNDVMVGTPSTYVQSREAGELKLASDMLGVDRYPVSLERAALERDGRLALRLKEIEPEESFLYGLKGHAYRVPAGHSLLQDVTHTRLYAVDTTKATTPASILHNGEVDCTAQFSRQAFTTHEAEKLHSLRLQRGDFLSFTVSRASGRHLVVSSFWRDWVAGMEVDAIHGVGRAQGTRPHLGRVVGMLTTKVAVLATMVAGLFVGHPSSKEQHIGTDDDLLQFIKKSNAVNVALADTPHTTTPSDGDADGNSLVVSYRHPSHGLFVHVGTVLPRAYRPTDVVVSLPEEAFDERGNAEVKIEATKQHYVKSVSILAGELAEAAAEKTFSFTAVHKRAGEVQSGATLPSKENPLHLVAGDTLELMTDAPVTGATHLAFEVHGFYTPLSAAGAKLAGNWKAQRTEAEAALMASIYGG